MPATKKKNFLFQEDWFNLISALPDASLGKVVRLMCDKAFRNMDYDPSTLEPMEQMAANFIMPKLEETQLHYEEVCAKRRANANKRWGESNSIQKNANAYNSIQKNANAEDKEKEIDKEIDKEKEKEKENESETDGVFSFSSLDFGKIYGFVDKKLRGPLNSWVRMLVSNGINPDYNYIAKDYGNLWDTLAGHSVEKATLILNCAVERKWKHLYKLPNNYALKSADIGRVVHTTNKDYTEGLELLTNKN